MSDPYRDSGHREQAEAPRDRGIVGDVIAQFADPNAFYRELVQNAIDADSEDVVVELRYDESAQRMHSSVRDRGSGMTREIIENQLLVLFRSTKEKDNTKIGKFGIGFKSVLAPDPEVVVVNTARDGKRLLVHLYRDLSYELFDGGRATQSGTTVEVQIAMQREQVDKFIAASEQALRHWCRHASVPIQLVIKEDAGARTIRIDQPLAIENAVIEVKRVFDDGQLTVLAGVTAKLDSYLGFFNHGLTLVETKDSSFGSVSVKVQDSRLGHTLSRDDVRRDGHYDHAMKLVKQVVHEVLPETASVKLRELAVAEQHGAHGKLLEAIINAKLHVRSWWFPLLEPTDERKAVEVTINSRVWASTRSTPQTRALLAAQVDVIRVTGDSNSFSAAIQRASSNEPGDPEWELTVVTPVERSEKDEVLVAKLTEIFDKVHRKPASIVLADIQGARGDRISIPLREESQRVVARDEAIKNPFAFLGRKVLGLSVAHPVIKAARDSDDPVLAASHVARAILLEHGLLDASRSNDVLAYTLRTLGIP